MVINASRFTLNWIGGSGLKDCSSLPRHGLPRCNPLAAAPIEIRRHAEIEGCTKNTVGQRDRGEPARFEHGVRSLRPKLMQQVSETVQGISSDQNEGKGARPAGRSKKSAKILPSGAV